MYTRFYRCLKREDNFIAGHSMGGYGTIKFALTQSQLFSKVAPLSLHSTFLCLKIQMV